VYAYQITSNDCARGADYECYDVNHPNPYVLRSGSETSFSILEKPGANIKIARVNNLQQGVFQIEYTLNRAVGTLAWDLSLIDGTSSAVPGNLFPEENVTATPSGDISDCSCKQVACPPAGANTPCDQAYWHTYDDAQAMRVCHT
jgi:hypothetical protein